MAQLSDDCFAAGPGLLRLDAAVAMIRNRIHAVTDVQTVPLFEARGRILAEDVVAAVDVPPHDNAAVDGYAVYYDDLAPARETRLPVIGRAAAGHAFTRALPRGAALRIFTGAPMPMGPDTVMMQEDCRETDGVVLIRPGIKRGANYRRTGEDIGKGERILPRGRRLRPEDLGLAAAAGLETLRVSARLKVGVFSTGDELAEPGQALPEGAIYDANRVMLLAMLADWGVAATDLGILRDDAAAMKKRLAKAAQSFDLLITSGGVSIGAEDHVKTAIEAQGRLSYWRLAIKPGRPVALGYIVAGDRQVPIAGLPGNPVAAFVTMAHLGRALVFGLMGAVLEDLPRFKVRAAFRHRKKPGRREWLRVRLQGQAADGLPYAQLFPREGAGILSSLVNSDGLAEIGEDILTVEAGAPIDFLPFALVR